MSQLAPHDPLAVYPAFCAGSGGLVVAAPAKLNFFLEITRKRPDGYHDLESLMVVVDLFDTLEFRPDSTGQITLTCDLPGLPTGPDNLVVKAAETVRRHVNRPDLGASIHLSKRIPSQAGLAGGSADAAITLLALNEIWNLGLTRPELDVMASQIGSDVAFFLSPPAAWCTGRGEIVEAESLGGSLHLVLVCPPMGLATAAVFRALQVPTTPRPGGAIRSAVRDGDPEAVGGALFNRLEEPSFALAPTVGQIRRRLTALAPCGALMSGSGSALFAVCRDRTEALALARRFRAGRPAEEPESRVHVVRTLEPA
jgi:4-diphosphocytidyl-2-C-methyl-D-erythritol kinase